jgi:hypothetical protein
MFPIGIGVEPKLTAMSITMSNNTLKLSSTSGVGKRCCFSRYLGSGPVVGVASFMFSSET